MRTFWQTLALLAVATMPLRAQNEAALKQYFEGRTLVVKLDLPATEGGVAGEHDGAPFYSMKFAEGGTLSARIDNYCDKPREAAALTAKLARAVAFAHENGILHRDLKQRTVRFDSAGKQFVSDFGLANWMQREGKPTPTLAIIGPPSYVAPEQRTA